MASHTVRASILGQTEKYTKVSGKQVSKKAKAYGRASLETVILASGTSQKQQDTVFIDGKMVTASKESGTAA